VLLKVRADAHVYFAMYPFGYNPSLTSVRLPRPMRHGSKAKDHDEIKLMPDVYRP